MNPTIAERIPLVCRNKPPGLPLQARIAELTALTVEPPGADHHQRVARASGALNFAALIASDTGLPDLAGDLCWRQHKIFTEAGALTQDIAVMALMPLVNIARLLIREGDGNAAYELLQQLYRAAQQRSATIIRDHEIDLAPLIQNHHDHRKICTELWVALLIDGARALAREGRWTEAADATHWSRASMAKRSGLSKSSIGRIWRDFGLKPHQADTFKLSTDPLFVEKVVDVVGLYHNPPDKAVVLCTDEKSQIQALDRSQPVLRMMPGMPERRTHDYARHGTTTLLAAFNIEDGTVIGELHRQHRAAEFKKFLITIDKRVPPELDVHLICDNYGTHKTPAIKTWLAGHPRFHMHFTPTGSSWINQVERWFGYLTDQMIRRGVHKSVQTLEKQIRDWISDWNDNPRPFVWKKTAEEILESLARYCRRISDAAH
ncbi:IS630 family transposase [Actinoallomurus iriomotensis]|uniref:Tc1-like transposase DDE domain-containing protein n=1 Tax=Actinoallomurus iriomotensis TaxID=478107 RepID=A0A9W6RY46_9ACTN|nr:hypothetical protein Airi01_102670 [Actinoallomurus iriomotensis]